MKKCVQTSTFWKKVKGPQVTDENSIKQDVERREKERKKNTTSMIIINSCDLFLYKSDMINNIPPRANFLLWGEIFLLCVQVKVNDRMTPIHFGLIRKCNEWPKYIPLWLIWCLVSQVDTSNLTLLWHTDEIDSNQLV